uniref:CASP-like protein n=1 Tax=Oryza brachyantha TaxID=4533 RepID=J3M642_ORYBR
MGKAMASVSGEGGGSGGEGSGSGGISGRYVVAIGVLAFIYTTLQLVRHGVRLTGGQDLQGKVAVLVDFAGDQVMAYLLMSAVSAAIPITNRMRDGADNAFTDSSAAALSMALLAFWYIRVRVEWQTGLSMDPIMCDDDKMGYSTSPFPPSQGLNAKWPGVPLSAVPPSRVAVCHVGILPSQRAAGG